MNNTADIIIKSTNIYKGIGNEILSGFIAIKENKIIKVGNNDVINNYIDENTKIIDYEDKLVMPGIHDAHLHFFVSGLYTSKKVKVYFTGLSEEECVNSLKDIEDLNTKDEWMIGAGWYHPLWTNPKLPTKYSLDVKYPDRPVCMVSYDYHTLWVNSFGMKKLGVDSNYPDIEGGTIDRDENGEPLGTFHEVACATLLQKIFDFDEKYIEEFCKDFMHILNSYGITSVCDLSLAPNGTNDFVKDNVFAKMEKDNELTVRIHMYPTMLEDMSRPLMMKEKYKGPLLYCNGVKQFFDGVSSCHTAWIREPYSNAYYEGDCGKPTIEPEQMRKLVLKAHENDMSIRVHTIGDKAICKMIDYIEEAEEKFGKKPYLQHTLEHLENVYEEDIVRLSEDNILLSMQPPHAVYDTNGVERDLGSERIKLMWPFRSEIDKGCKIAFGTDSPIVEVNPFYGIYNAITRKNTFSRLPENGWIPKEKITSFEAVSAYTYGSACACKAEDLYGTLEENKYADICVLDRNILTIDPELIPDTKCLMTMLDGKIIYENKE